jgi:3-oxoacyl-ACP reductase-like protein
MNPLFTTSNITFTLGILALIFSVYSSFRNPQTEIDKRQALDKEEGEGKTNLIEERAKWDRENNETKFKDMGTRLENAFTLANNHTHTVDVKVDKLIESVNAMNIQMTKEMTRLGTIIEERFPKNKTI